MAEPASRPKRSLLARFLRTVLRALLFAFVVGFLIGTWLRCGLEQTAPSTLPYLGAKPSAPGSDAVACRAA